MQVEGKGRAGCSLPHHILLPCETTYARTIGLALQRPAAALACFCSLGTIRRAGHSKGILQRRPRLGTQPDCSRRPLLYEGQAQRSKHALHSGCQRVAQGNVRGTERRPTEIDLERHFLVSPLLCNSEAKVPEGCCFHSPAAWLSTETSVVSS